MTQIRTALRTAVDVRRSRVLLVEGAPGAGKTRLLAEAIEVAISNGFSVVHGASGDSGSGNHLVLRPSPVKSPRTSASENGCRVMTLTFPVNGIVTWLRGILGQGPVLVTLDDLRWDDASTLRVLCDLITNLNAYPIVWIMAFSSDAGDVSRGPMGIHLGRLRAEWIAALDPLSSDAVAQLVSDYLGAIPDPAIIALAEGVSSLPRAVIDLVHGLVQDGELRVVDGTASLRPTSGPARPMAAGVCEVPRRFAAAIHRSLQSLSPSTRTAVRLAAVLGTSFTPKSLSSMLDESPAGLLTLLDEALACGLVVCRADDFAFRSEPVWQVVLDSIPAPIRVLLHRQAAAILLSQPDGMEAAALHLAHSAQRGDVEAVRIISQAAARLLGTAPLNAASLATRGMELLGPEQPERISLAALVVEAFVRAGKVDRAIGLSEDTIHKVAELGRQASGAHAEALASLQAWMSVALLLKGKPHQAVRVAHHALAVPEGELKHHERAEISRLAGCLLIDEGAAVQRGAEILSSSGRHPRAVHSCALIVRAWDQWRCGQVDRAISILNDAVELDCASTDVQLLDPRWILATIYTKLCELGEASALIRACSRAVEDLASTPLPAAVPTILRASVHLLEGRLGEADEDARAGIAAMAEGCRPMPAPLAWGVLIRVALRRGDLTLATEHLSALEEHCPLDCSRPWWAMRCLLSAQLAEATGGPRAAMTILEGVLANAGVRRELILEDPAAAAWCVRAALAADMPDAAGMVIDTAESLRARNRNMAAVCAAAMHARALLRCDADTLAHVAQLHRDPWARASALEDRAVQLLARGDRDTAINDLERAMGGYHALGSERDAARVRRRLRHLGVRRRHWTHTRRPVSGWDSLTKTERRVAEHVASGLTNRQVASQMFVSPHTVGFHLRQIYRKLEIRSRVDLVRYKS